MEKTLNIVADIGNSRIKLLFENEYIAIENSLNWKSTINQILREVNKQVKFCYSSVNTSIEVELLNIISNYQNVEILNANYLLSQQKIIDTSSVTGMGSDRILGLIRAISLNGYPVITIDLGTAVTINYADNGKCIGGAIFPGAETQKNSLINISEKLNIDKFDFSNTFYGNSTEQAINSGIFLSVIGGIEKSLEMAKTKFGENFLKNIYITGGTSPLFLKFIENKYTINYVPNLVLEGILELLKNYNI